MKLIFHLAFYDGPTLIKSTKVYNHAQVGGWDWLITARQVQRGGLWVTVSNLSNTPFRRPSCQAREEKRKFSPTATSLRRRRQRSRSWATAQRALAEERKWRPKVHQARRDDRFSSRFLSLLLTAAIVPTRPTPLLLCSPLPLSLSPSPTRFDAFKDVIVSIVHNMLPSLGEQPRHLGYRPVYVGFFPMTFRFPRVLGWATGSLNLDSKLTK